MAVSEKVTCDVCEIERGPSNHWVMVASLGEHGITFEPWDNHNYLARGHICGTEGASKLVARAIDEWRKS